MAQLSPFEGESNPYSSPKASLIAVVPNAHGDDETVRRRYLNHEMDVKAAGSLHLIGAVLGAIGFIGGAAIVVSGTKGDSAVYVPLTVLYFVFSAILLTVGSGLRKLRPWARWTEVVLIGLSLALKVVSALLRLLIVGAQVSPMIVIRAIGWVIPAYILYLMLSPKAAVVFSREYQGVIDRTPHVTLKTSRMTKMVLVLLAVSIVGAIVLRREGG